MRYPKAMPVLLLALAGCARSGPRDAPEATLARSGGASLAFSNLRKTWSAATRDERIALAPELRRLRQAYANEPVARMADVYLAWVALEQGRFDEAAARSSAVEAGRGGNTRDLATLLAGATLARRGWPDAALAKLLPLLGRLLDPYARELLYEEATRAALQAHRYSDAIEVLDAWLRDTTEDDLKPTLVRVDEALAAMPEAALEQARARLKEPGHSELLERALGKRLAAIAVERGDAALARRLLREGSGVGSLGAEGAGVLQLANVDDGAPRVAGRTVGFVAETEPTRARQRSTEAALGLLGSLGLVAGDEPPNASARVIQREAPSGLGKAAQGLADAGAVVLVGGLTAETSTDLAAFAETAQIPALLLVPPGRAPTTSDWAFVLGLDPDASDALLVNALADRGARTIAVIGAPTALVATGDARVLPSVDCPTGRAVHLPFAEWRAQGVDALLVAGDLACARAIDGALRVEHAGPRLALGAESAALLIDHDVAGALVPRVGRFPTDEAGRTSAALRAFAKARGEPVTFWTVLGRDAGDALASALPSAGADDAEGLVEVRKRRTAVRDALRNAPPGRTGGLVPRSTTAVPPAPVATPTTPP